MPFGSDHKRAAGTTAGSRPAVVQQVDPAFAKALEQLYSRVNFEHLKPAKIRRDEYKLDRMAALAKALGDPQETVRHVHVAGTKGKGSTCWMTAAMLEACGYTTGLYTSPHLVDIRERICINRQMVSMREFARLTDEVLAAAQGIEEAMGPCTFFELTTMMALLHFAQQAVDVAVIEVGLGGLLDCTNIINPEVCGISTIGMDHMQVLGDTVELIAQQKAGIFKRGVPALVIQQDEAVLAVMKQEAEKRGAPLTIVGKDLEFVQRVDHPAGEMPRCRVSLTTPRHEYEFVAVPMPGEYQALNCGLALAMVDRLVERGFEIDPDRALAGLQTTRVPGRFEILGSSPRVLLDGAHNGDSIKALMKAIGQFLQYDALVVIFGCAADKDTGTMLRHLASAADKVIFTRVSDNSRAADPEALARQYAQIDEKPAMWTSTLEEALQRAKNSIQGNDVLAITGSFYLVGEAKKIFAARQQAGAGAGRKR